MVDLTDPAQAKALKQDIDYIFNTPQGKNVMRFMQEIGGWFPTVFDSNETNDIIARDANRRLIGTLRTMMEIAPEQIVTLALKDAQGQ